MRKNLIRFGITLGVIGLFALTALYNSYVYKYDFLISLHFILTNILSGIWILISNPVIFIVLTLIAFLIIYRRYIPDILRRIKQAKAYGVEFLFEETEKNVISSIRETDVNEVPPKRIEVEKIINSIDKELCEYLIEKDNKSMPQIEIFHYFGEKYSTGEGELDGYELGDSQKKFVVYLIKLNAGIGYFYLFMNFQGVLFTISRNKEEKSMTVSLYPIVKKLILERLAREVETEKKPTPKPVEGKKEG